MSKEKQIEEMAFDLCLIDTCKHLTQTECNNTTCAHCEAEALYNAGYRKQREWISIAERLPEKSGRYLVYGSFAGMPLICGAHYDRYNGFGDDGFTHWMPLPEPPREDTHDPA